MGAYGFLWLLWFSMVTPMVFKQFLTTPHADPISLLISTFGIPLEPGCESHGQTIHYRSAKKVPTSSDSFSLLSHNLTRKVYPVIWPLEPR